MISSSESNAQPSYNVSKVERREDSSTVSTHTWKRNGEARAQTGGDKIIANCLAGGWGVETDRQSSDGLACASRPYPDHIR